MAAFRNPVNGNEITRDDFHLAHFFTRGCFLRPTDAPSRWICIRDPIEGGRISFWRGKRGDGMEGKGGGQERAACVPCATLLPATRSRGVVRGRETLIQCETLPSSHTGTRIFHGITRNDRSSFYLPRTETSHASLALKTCFWNVSSVDVWEPVFHFPFGWREKRSDSVPRESRNYLCILFLSFSSLRVVLLILRFCFKSHFN